MGVTPDASSPPTVAPHLWRIHGRSYDLSAFASQHPGGHAALALGRGDDCTLLFESYHISSARHRSVLSRYLVDGDGTPISDSSKAVSSDTQALSPFHRDALAMLRSHFSGQGRAAHKAKAGHSALMLLVVSLYALSWIGWARGSLPAAVALPFLAWLVMYVPRFPICLPFSRLPVN